MPVFWLGFLLMYVFALKFHLLPAFGYTSPFTNFTLSTKQLIMPVICLAIGPIAINARQARSSMLEVMRQDYIRTAWSKGLREQVVIIKHALKNALIPVVVLIGLAQQNLSVARSWWRPCFNIPGMEGWLLRPCLIRISG